MQQELDWPKLPVLKITEKDRELARMILSGTPNGDDHKMTRGFLYYNIVEGEFVLVDHYNRFLTLLRAYILRTWNVQDWDAAIEGKTAEELEWEPHLDAYRLLKLAEKRIERIAQ